MKKNRSKYRIAIVGIGGVGGYIGALLASKYHDDEDVKVIFVARGENEKKIKQDGLTLITSDRTVTVFPELVSKNPEDIKRVDLLICAVKSYDLTGTMEQLRGCIDESTFILPLENGVDASDKIKSVIPDAKILYGCIYINSRLIEPGIVKQTGKLHSLYVGSDKIHREALMKIHTLLKGAGIDVSIADNIQQALWEKFVFISAIATVTSYADASIGEVLKTEATKKLLLSLIGEVKTVADANGILLPGNISDTIIEKASSMPFDATSSMHSDLKNGKQTEITSLTGYVVKEGRKLNVAVPAYEFAFTNLMNRMNQPIEVDQ